MPELTAKKSDIKFNRTAEYEIDIVDINIRPYDKNVILPCGQLPLTEKCYDAIRTLLMKEIPNLPEFKSCYIAKWSELKED